MTNEQMTPGRFLRIQQARTKYRAIVEHLRAGGHVMLGTYTRATEYKPQHADWFAIVGHNVYVRQGKSRVCIDGCAVRFSRLAKSAA